MRTKERRRKRRGDEEITINDRAQNKMSDLEGFWVNRAQKVASYVDHSFFIKKEDLEIRLPKNNRWIGPLSLLFRTLKG